MIKRVWCFLLLSVFFVPAVSAQLFYQWRDNQGRWNFSDNPPSGVTGENVKVIFYPPSASTSRDPYHQGYREGYDLGYEQGYKDYFKKRFEQGRQEGYKEGYQAWRTEDLSPKSRSSR